MGNLDDSEVECNVSCIWEIKKTGKKDFSIDGLATVRAVVIADGEPNSMWRMEVGASDGAAFDHPGPYFHVQVLGPNASEINITAGLFPYEVPRFPFHPSTPSAALEFVVTELFSEEWKRHKSKERSLWLEWAARERTLWDRYLIWQRQIVGQKADSPLALLKQYSPGRELLPKR